MLSEAIPAIQGKFEDLRSRVPKSSPTAVVQKAGFKVDDVDAMMEYSWRRPNGDVGITLWLEDIYPVSGERWLLVDTLDTTTRRGGGDRSPEQVRRAERRVANLTRAFEGERPMIGFLQTNRVPIREMEKNRSAKVDVRVRDPEEWVVAELRPDLDRVVLQRGRGWAPTEAEIEAASRWRNTRQAPRPGRRTETVAHYDPNTAPMLYVNMAWMKEYRGQSEDDPVHGGNFRWLKTDGRSAADAHEQFNFEPLDDRVFAYVPGSPTPNITRLGAARSDGSLAGVLVAFMARDPADGLTKIVGCYHNAVVHRGLEYTHRRHGIDVQSPISALADNAQVIPVAERWLTVPHWRQAEAEGASGGYGQSALWYGADEIDGQVRQLLARTWRSGDAGPRPPKPPRRTPRQPDTAKRLAVEAAAMSAAMEYFGTDRDVSDRCLGWDLEADGIDCDIYIEVKGLSGPQVNIELTPNEYEKMWLHRHRYVLFVLTNALGASPRISVFRHRLSAGKAGGGQWVSTIGSRLNIREVKSAVCVEAN